MVYVNARLYYILNVSNTNIGLCFLVEANVVVFSSLTPNLIEEWKIKIKKTVPLKLEGRGAKRRREYELNIIFLELPRPNGHPLLAKSGSLFKNKLTLSLLYICKNKTKSGSHAATTFCDYKITVNYLTRIFSDLTTPLA